MLKKLKFYRCKHCGNVVVKLEDSGVSIVCCGEKMDELIPGTIDASLEKHIPVVEIINGEVKVEVGEILHPMLSEHYISWILMVTEKGYEIKYLTVPEEPKVIFKTNEKILEVYEYCNIHGLWKKELN